MKMTPKIRDYSKEDNNIKTGNNPKKGVEWQLNILLFTDTSITDDINMN